MKTTARKALCFALSLLLMMSVLTSNALTTFVSATTYSGVCGNHLNWSFDTATKKLSITGTGEMYTYSDYSLTPWYKYGDSIQAVEIANGVTSVTDHAFLDCSFGYYQDITVLTLGNTLTTIGRQAFEDCSGLTILVLPNSITAIGEGAFGGCSGLTSVTLPNSLQNIESSVFRECTALTGIIIPNSVKSIGDGAFAYCEGLTNITIGSGVTSIGEFAFGYCSGLKSLTVPNAVKSIGDDAFEGCSGLQSISIPDTLTSLGAGALSDCSGLTSITIPKGLTSIEYGTFSNCGQLTSVIIPNSITSIGWGAFYECTKLASVTITGSVTEFGTGVFDECDILKVWCIRNSAAHTYAIENGLTFDFLIAVSSVALNASSCTLNSGATKQLTPTVLPANAYDKSVSWKSSNTSVVTVSSSGLVTAKAAGQATVTCTAKDGSGKYASCIVTVKPAAPASPRAASVSYNSIKVSWNAVAGATGYAIYRSTSSTGGYTRIKTVTATSYTDPSLTTGKNYYYKVFAYKTIGGVNQYSPASAVVSAKPIPATPTNFKAVRYSATSIKLTWSPVTGASGYVLYKYNTSTKTWARLKVLTATSYINTGLAKGVTCYYKVRAYRTMNSSPVYGNLTATVSAKTY